MQDKQAACHKEDRDTPGERKDDKQTLQSTEMCKYREDPCDPQHAGAEDRKNCGQCGMSGSP